MFSLFKFTQFMRTFFVRSALRAAVIVGSLFGSLLGLSLTSCDSFLDVNTNPNYPETTLPSALLPSIIANGTNQYFQGLLWSIHFVQHVGGRAANNGRDQFFLTRTASPFNDTYFRVAGNIAPMNKAAAAEGSWYYVGAGHTMMAMAMFNLTDLHGDIPYSRAFGGPTNFAPTYDSQESVYAEMFKLLDSAIIEFNKPTSIRALNERSADLFFAGDRLKWKKFAFALKARQLNHLTKKSTYNPQAVLAAVDSAMTSNADDAQLSYAGQLQDGNTNPWNPRRGNGNAITFGRYFIQMLNGTTLGEPDPRLRIIAPGNRGGVVNGSGESPAQTRTDFYGIYNTTAIPPAIPDTLGWYSRPDGIQLVFTNAELRFIEAEAAFRSGNTARAYTAYVAGIRAHMTKLGVPAAAITTYLASRAVPQNMGALTLKNIMEQKYIALFLHPEAWVDMRRFDYSPDIYTNFQQPTTPNMLMMGQFPRRFLPGTQEDLYNSANAYKEVGGPSTSLEQITLTPVWWDKR